MSTTCSPIDRLLQTLRVHVPGVTDPLLQLEIFNVMDEFFRRTSAWRYEDSIDLEVGKNEYAFAVPADSTVVRLMAVSHNDMPIASTQSTSVSVSTLGRLVPDMIYSDGDASFTPSTSDLNQSNLFTYAVYRPEYIQTTGQITDEMTVFPLKAVLALSLARSCLECDCGDWAVPDWTYDSFFQDWVDGCLGRLYAMPAKPWAAQTQAIYHLKRFRNAMALRKQEVMRGFAFDVPVWRFPQGGWV